MEYVQYQDGSKPDSDIRRDFNTAGNSCKSIILQLPAILEAKNLSLKNVLCDAMYLSNPPKEVKEHAVINIIITAQLVSLYLNTCKMGSA